MRVIPKNTESDIEQHGATETEQASFFDATVGNVPVGGTIGLIMTVVSIVVITTNMGHCEQVLLKYNSRFTDWSTYQNIVLGCLLALHTGVFGHGVAVGCLETSRELCHAEEIGCYACCCKDPLTRCGANCRKCQSYGRSICQVGWATVGTALIFLFYVGLVGTFSVASTSTLFAYLFAQTCQQYSQLIDVQTQKAYAYLNDAKQYIGRADNVTKHFLLQYNQWMDLQESFRNSAMNQMANVETISYTQNEQIMWKPSREEFRGRKLMYDPRLAMAQGQSTIATLNQTIAHTEQQLRYFEGQFQESVVFCNDYAGMYGSLYSVTVGVGILLVAHFIIYGSHYKYFTAWYYESKLLRSKNYT